MTIARVVSVAALLAAVSGCGNSYGSGATGPTGSAGPTVTASDNLTFAPASLSVHPGDVVTFDFGSVAHNVFFDAATGAPPDIGGSNAGVAVARTFSTAGTFRYACHIHPGMTGTVVVAAP